MKIVVDETISLYKSFTEKYCNFVIGKNDKRKNKYSRDSLKTSSSSFFIEESMKKNSLEGRTITVSILLFKL